MTAYGGRGPTVNAVLWTETAVASIFVILRVYTRKVLLRSFGWDDACLVLTLLLLAGYAACISLGTAYGLGQKRADLDPADYMQAMKMEIIGQGVCIFNIATSKAAVGLFLLRIVVKQWHKVVIWVCIVTNSLMAAWTTVAVFIQCIPVQSVWDSSITGNCWLDFAKVGLTCSAYAVVIDFIFALAPFVIIWELQMKRKDKILTVAGLSLGVFAGVCGILRTTSLTSLRSFSEYIYDTVDMLIYSGTENFVSAICASIPVLRPMWVRYIRRYGSSDDSHGRSYKLSDLNRSDPESQQPRSGIKGGLETRIYAGQGLETDGNISEESILRNSNIQQNPDEVYCKTDIKVNYMDRQ